MSDFILRAENQLIDALCEKEQAEEFRKIKHLFPHLEWLLLVVSPEVKESRQHQRTVFKFGSRIEKYHFKISITGDPSADAVYAVPIGKRWGKFGVWEYSIEPTFIATHGYMDMIREFIRKYQDVHWDVIIRVGLEEVEEETEND